MDVAAGVGNSLFYSLRAELHNGKKIVRLYQMRKVYEHFEEEGLTLDDDTSMTVIPRLNEGSFIVVGNRRCFYTSREKTSVLKLPQTRGAVLVGKWRRVSRERK